MKKRFSTTVAPTRPLTVEPSIDVRKNPSMATVPADAGRMPLSALPPA
jgi:hypothetical protein